jgi:hypothetical protein
MQIKTVCSTAQQNAKRDLAAVKEMAKTRGETYLEYAKNYLIRRDLRNARATAIEGRRLCRGPFYLAIQEQLDDLIRDIHTAETTHLQQTESAKDGDV